MLLFRSKIGNDTYKRECVWWPHPLSGSLKRLKNQGSEFSFAVPESEISRKGLHKSRFSCWRQASPLEYAYEYTAATALCYFSFQQAKSNHRWYHGTAFQPSLPQRSIQRDYNSAQIFSHLKLFEKLKIALDVPPTAPSLGR
jgi:hypothetical protein